MKKYHIDRIVAPLFGVSVARMHQKTQKEPVIFARMLAMLLCHELLGHNWNRLRRAYNKQSHSTVRHAVITARNMVETNSLFREKYNTALAECRALSPLIKRDQRRYNMHFNLRAKSISVDARQRTISIGQHQENFISENKSLRRFITKNNYAIQYAIL